MAIIDPAVLERISALLELPIVITQRDIADVHAPIPQVQSGLPAATTTRPLRLAGVQTLNDLLQLTGNSVVELAAAVGAPNGITSLDDAGKVPVAELPAEAFTVKPPVVQNFDLDGLEAPTGSRATIVNQRAYYYPVVVPTNLTFARLEMRITNGTMSGTTSHDISLGLYEYVDATRLPGGRIFSGTAAGITDAADISITAFTGSPIVAAGRYYLAVLANRTAGAGDIRGVVANNIDDVDMGFVADQIKIQDGVAALPAAAIGTTIPPGDVVHWARGIVSLV